MLDQVYLQGLEVETLIGVYEFERTRARPLFLDLELTFNCQPAGVSDELEDALDYDALSRRVREWAGVQRFQLLEAFSEALCVLINAEFGVQKIVLTVNKPEAVPKCAAMGIKIERQF